MVSSEMLTVYGVLKMNITDSETSSDLNAGMSAVTNFLVSSLKYPLATMISVSTKPGDKLCEMTIRDKS